jgi:hypothetical protein
MKYDDAGSSTMTTPMRRPKRILYALLAVVSGLLYIWFAAVRAVPSVRRRKAAARQRAGG